MQIETEREEYSKRSRPDDDRPGLLEHQHQLQHGGVPGGVRLPLDLSSSHQQMPMNPVFLNPMNIPFPGAEKVPGPPQVNLKLTFLS